MTRNEIMRMAKQAGGRFDGSDWRFLCDFDDEDLERFAALVAAAEREACASLVESEWATDGEKSYGDELATAIRARSTA